MGRPLLPPECEATMKRTEFIGQGGTAFSFEMSLPRHRVPAVLAIRHLFGRPHFVCQGFTKEETEYTQIACAMF